MRNVFNFKSPNVFPRACTILHTNLKYMRFPMAPHPCQQIVLSLLLRHSIKYVAVWFVALIYISLKINDKCLFPIHMYSFVNYL